MNQFKSYINQLREIFPNLEDPNELKSLDDCKLWFRDYKKEIKSLDQEYQYCLETLKALDNFDKKRTKNANYNEECTTIINGLFVNYVKEKL